MPRLQEAQQANDWHNDQRASNGTQCLESMHKADHNTLLSGHQLQASIGYVSRFC
jgi:hypothetical protein